MYKLYLILFFGLILSCSKGPEEIQAKSDPNNQGSQTGIFNQNQTSSNDASQNSFAQDLHTIQVKEVLPTERYVYLRAEEDGEEIWVSTNKQPIDVGATYFFRGGLLKTNFKSEEYDRVFEKLYLVSKVVPVNHGGSSLPESDASANNTQNDAETNNQPSMEVAGSMKIADLVTNPQAYADKTIQLTGKCVKLNANIMGRNWIHLQDGSKDDFDLVITSAIPIPVGQVVTMSGIVRLNKDFCAGYSYDIIVEEGQLVKQ